MLQKESMLTNPAGMERIHSRNYGNGNYQHRRISIWIFSAPGTVWVDYVSLFPKDTYKRKRERITQGCCQMLADLKPAFMRWPGGCIVEAITIENQGKVERDFWWSHDFAAESGTAGDTALPTALGIMNFYSFVKDMGGRCHVCWKCRNFLYVQQWRLCERSELPAFIQDIRDDSWLCIRRW